MSTILNGLCIGACEIDVATPLLWLQIDCLVQDEGGVTKEFFQILIQQLFNENYGMFVYNSQTRTFWFNMLAQGMEPEFELVGIVLGLAIYNGVILDVHFPLVVFKKLLNQPVTLVVSPGLLSVVVG